MYLDAVRTNGHVTDTISSDPVTGRGPAHAPWENWQPTMISHHGAACCEIAREWIGSFDRSVLNGASPLTGPRWLGSRFQWGPVRYPIFWCEVVRERVLDCGVHAALAHEVFTDRGVRSYRLQLIQEYSVAAAAQWHAVWSSEEAVTDWISGNLIYHEGCAVQLENGSLKLWDSSAGWWIDPNTTSGYGGVRAVRVTCPSQISSLAWAGHAVTPNVWNELQ